VAIQTSDFIGNFKNYDYKASGYPVRYIIGKKKDKYFLYEDLEYVSYPNHIVPDGNWLIIDFTYYGSVPKTKGTKPYKFWGEITYMFNVRYTYSGSILDFPSNNRAITWKYTNIVGVRQYTLYVGGFEHPNYYVYSSVRGNKTVYEYSTFGGVDDWTYQISDAKDIVRSQYYNDGQIISNNSEMVPFSNMFYQFIDSVSDSSHGGGSGGGQNNNNDDDCCLLTC